MSKKHYLNTLPEDEVKELILYPSEIYSHLYEIAAEDNSEYASDLANSILGKDYHLWTKYDDCSYNWWLNIKPGHYNSILDVTEFDYFSNEDAAKFKELQSKVKDINSKIDKLEFNDDYYEKIGRWEDEADDYADEALQIVVDLLKRAEEVTDEQVVDLFMLNFADEYYYLDDDKSTIYRDYTKSYRVK